MASAVIFDNVSKKFRRGERHDSLRDLVPSLFRRRNRRQTAGLLSEHEFWALRGVSFTVEPGEAIGIIGANGAGKSTTLKLLTRILKPTLGRCAVRGRVGALIEVAAGFHPDLTGRENIFLQGAIMGMKRSEIARRFDEIVDFAGVAAFLDTPVKRYSSGMNARLGFSIAAHLEPEVLIVDEVLSVGDMTFQQKCVARMKGFLRSGVTIVFVSHNLQAVSDLCQSALYLQGDVRAFGPTGEVLQAYLSGVRSIEDGHISNGEVEITSCTLLDSSGHAPQTVAPGTDLVLRVCYRARRSLSDITFGFMLRRSTDGLIVYDGNVPGREVGLDAMEQGDLAAIDFAFRAHLTRGHYSLDSHVFHNTTQTIVARSHPPVSFAVNETRTFAGIADLQLRPKVVHQGIAYTQ